MKQQIIILHTNRYDMEDRVTREINRGISVTYLPNGSLAPKADGTQRGDKPAKGSLKYEQEAELAAVPGVYDAELNFKINKDGKPELALESVSFVGDIDYTVKKSGIFGAAEKK